MSLLHKLFTGRLNRKGFWTIILLSQLTLHAVAIALTSLVFEGNPFSTTYLSNYPPEVLFPDFMPAYLFHEGFDSWPAIIDGAGLFVWLLVLVVTTLAFARRLADIKVTQALAVAYPITMVWLTFGAFWPYETLLDFNEESVAFIAFVIIIYAAGFFTLIASLLPSKK